MANLFVAGITAVAVLTVCGKYRSPWLHYVCKPLTMLLILALALSLPIQTSPVYRWLVVAALLCSLVGDVFLMLPRKLFLAGLGSFLVAHLIYIAAFGLDGRHSFPPWLIAIVVLFALAGMAVLLPRAGRLRIPVAIYVTAIAVMALTAVARSLSSGNAGAGFAAVGAVLFVISDSLLGWNRFVKPFAAAEALLLFSYFAGQTLIALSV